VWVRRETEGSGAKAHCHAESASADLSSGTQFSRRAKCGGTQSTIRIKCRSAQSRHKIIADIRRLLLVKLRTPFEIIIDRLLSIAAEFWV